VNQTIYLVDASLYVFRAWHSMAPEFFDREGAPVNAVYGFTRFVCDFLEQTQPSHVVFAFDESLTSSFRNGIYPAYKANRELPPPELKIQFAYCKQVAEAMGCTVLSDLQYEADDLIGSVIHQLRPHRFRSVIVSADKDFGQLLTEHDHQWDFARQYKWGMEGVVEKFGVRPDQLVDFLALTGDAIDNIPGVPGIGNKTAAALLQHFETLEAIFARIDEIPYLRFRGAAASYAKLQASKELAVLSQQLSRIAIDAPVPTQPEHMLWQQPNLTALDDLFEQLRFGPLTRSRCRTLKKS